MKKIISILVFLILLFISIDVSGEILTEKSLNRYYILEKELEQKNEKYDVQIYGSCHAYTSFNPMYLIENYDISTYNMANPSEIIPITYLRMKEQFETNKPKVALVEVWGINVYETYISTDSILGDYLKNNLERLPLSLDKLEVISDFETVDILEENFPIIRYKDRVLNLSLTEVDFNYSFELLNQTYNIQEEVPWLYNEMVNRFSHNGYKLLGSENHSDYPEKQPSINADEIVNIEEVILKYLDKIIKLCDEKNVELIFYRAPYISTENELKKVNHLKAYLSEKRIPFIDLEKAIKYDYDCDFNDYEHLSESGAEKSTEFLCSYILNMID